MEEISKETNESNNKRSDIITNLDYLVSELVRFKENIALFVNEIQRFNENNDSLFGHIEKFRRLLHFKINNLLEWFLQIEDIILSSTIDVYYDELLNSEDRSSLTIEEVNRLTDAFITQYFSLFDIFIKCVIKIKFPDSNLKSISSLGSLYYYTENNNDNSEIINLFEPLLSSKSFFNEFKNYRDFLVHQGKLNIEITRDQANNQGYALNSFFMTEISKVNPKEYTENILRQTKLNFVIRHSLALQLQSFMLILDKIRLEYYN